MDEALVIESGRKLRCPDNSIVVFKSLLGHGATGAVYRCERILADGLQDGCALAAKVIDVRHLRLSRNFDREREKIKREIAILASLSHTGVVNLHGVIDSDDMLVLLMDLVEGGELFDFVLSKGCLAEDEARYVFAQFISTLKFLHEQGIIHRDIKLENVLVEGEVAPGYYHVKIADFGLSKLVAGGFTRARSYVGTPQYWAPEVVRAGFDGQSYSFEADIWSMGCLLYVMVGGCYPFNGEAIDDQVLRGDYSFDGPRFQNVSQECKSLISGMLQVDPQKRYTLADIETHPWMTRPLPVNYPPLPILRQTTRVPIIMNVGPTIVGARNADTDPMKDIVVPATPTSPPSSRTRSQIDHAVELFNASELLDLLGNTFYRFHAAYVAFRMHRKISSEIQAMLLEIKDLTLQSTKVFKGFFYTCQQVVELINDVTMAVSDGDASLAVALLDQLKDWVQDTLKDGTEIRQRFGAAVKRATLLVAYSRDLNAPWHESWTSFSACPELRPNITKFMLKEVPAEAPAMEAADVLDNHKYKAARQDLFQDIQSVDERWVDKSASVANRLLDFLFVSPAVVPPNETSSIHESLIPPEMAMNKMVEKSDPASTLTGASSSSTSGTVPHQEMTDIVPAATNVAVAHQSAAVATEWKKATYLMQGLEELQRVSDILEQCSSFWDNLDLTLGLVQKFKDQIVIILKHSASPSSSTRLSERLKQYEGFWISLGGQCDSYVKGAKTQSERMKVFVTNFNNTVVKNNCAASIYRVAQPMSNSASP
eukprot:Gregarina_sp_Poly_1__2028@NODE_1532_length_3918_cov_126_566346_g1011_i0_p1_GENE_NODE_1532_length_3918_cov_126_566346_g1011_i0NODE_1532_length_3918_cov_126_566346_g1011_i0_p1_ORF_typecomplete_len784_score101_80Pkinase/PF00069_25/7_9e68Pkinase_Tyr/PF07714_17/8_7e41Kinaselike/PF14531_6/6_4e15Pkinase_fungal/PF17667_1/5_6e10Pkinase_fungal/PF17667_1/4_7e03Kdo/PF06293_14/1_9e08Kdo/PF06293_14/2_9e03Kdo/PF06293_14/6_2e03Kdo/PF06293_14/63RIO1/PF01163_22/7_7e05APH/PF01636_23/0_00059APH/PF01636_23/3_1e03Waa